MHTEHLYIKSMKNIHNTDYAFIALTTARIASQLKSEYSINCSFSLCENKEVVNYVIIGIHDTTSICLRTFHLYRQTPRDLMDEVFEYCLTKDLFKIPMNIQLVD